MNEGLETPPADLEALLRQRFPTFAGIVADARASGDSSKLKRFVELVRAETATALASETNSKRKAEIENVLLATEAAAALAVQIAFPQEA